MNIKSTVFLVLILSIVLRVTHGYLGCSDPLISCSNETRCVNIEKICIDHHDCNDGTGVPISCNYCQKDETDSIACVTHIEPQIIFECLSPNQICDGTPDCINKKDEELCGIKKCKHNFWPCTNGICIEKTRICDAHKDCSDGSDEGLICHRFLCGSDEIRCLTGECISESKLCDGILHCSDGFDEENCLHLTSITSPMLVVKDSCSTASNTFTCSTSGTSIHPMCISDERVCDGYKDCPVGDDEHGCSDQCTSKSSCIANPDVTCLQHPGVGQLCRCKKSGYHLTNDSSDNNAQVCQDFDECSDSRGTYCSFKCFNTDGNFNCTCPSGFIINEETKTCRRINDLSKPNLFVLFDDDIILYKIRNNTGHYSSRLLNRINIEKNHPFDRIQYDPNQMFVIHYDRSRRAILCDSNTTLKTILLISNITVNGFAYNANEKTLFIIENQTRTLRIYTSITCDITYHIQMHSWPLDHISNSINSMEIDVYNRQIIFASNNQFMISNMSEPNSTTVVYTTDRPIYRFVYDAAFKRIFWTTVNIKNDELFPVYTCDGEFKQCHDTSVRLPTAWPFAFYDDSLLFAPISLKSLETVQLYGKNRFSNRFITSTPENIHSFLLINHQTADVSNLCAEYSTTRCKGKLCLQINSTEVNCLSIDEFVTSEELRTNFRKSVLENAIDSLLDNDLVSQSISQQKKHRHRSTNAILFGIIIFGLLAVILAYFVKRYHQRLNEKTLDYERHQNEQFISTNEPNLDEFSITVDDRVSKHGADYAREMLIENPSCLIFGRRRDSI